MGSTRQSFQVLQSQPAVEGAGVHLRRAFGHAEVPLLDPFLLLDDFRGDDPRHYEAGFPWHPHRGMETITYVLAGEVDHGDSLGNRGTVGVGDVQWMTAGNGIIHQEMPRGDARGRLAGFQLWANLPANRKRMAPRYQDVPAARIPEVDLGGGVRVRVVAGSLGETSGPVRDVVTEPRYLDVALPAGGRFRLATPADHTVFAYVFDGAVRFDRSAPASTRAADGTLVVFEPGDEVIAVAEERPGQFLLVSGRPLQEPVAWYGPMVMNTDDEIRTALDEFRRGTFLRMPARPGSAASAR